MYFQDRISWTICLGWLQYVILLIAASWVARITSASLFFFFKDIFVYDGCIGSFIVTFPYIYYTPNWFLPSIILLSTLVPFLWRFQQFE
jgi:hypothetical protein